MMMGVYVALGIFLLVAARNPSPHRSLIAFAAWSSFADAAVTSALALEISSEHTGFRIGWVVVVVVGAALIVLAPRQAARTGESSLQLACAAHELGLNRLTKATPWLNMASYDMSFNEL